MKISRRLQKARPSLSDFADQEGLTLNIRERRHDLVDQGMARFFVYFAGTELRSNGVTHGTAAYGNGPTEDEAISDYMFKIAGRILIIDPYTNHTREVPVPYFCGIYSHTAKANP